MPDKASSENPRDQLDPAMCLKPFVKAVHVGMDSGLCQAEGRGDLFVTLVGHHAAKDFHLARRKIEHYGICPPTLPRQKALAVKATAALGEPVLRALRAIVRPAATSVSLLAAD